MDFQKGQSNNRIRAVSALYKAYKALDAGYFIDMLTALKEAWDGDMDAVSAQIINAMSVFYRTYGGNFKRDDLVNSLKKIKPAAIIRNGRVYGNKSNAYVREIVKAYNNRRRIRLDETLL